MRRVSIRKPDGLTEIVPVVGRTLRWVYIAGTSSRATRAFNTRSGWERGMKYGTERLARLSNADIRRFGGTP